MRKQHLIDSNVVRLRGNGVEVLEREANTQLIRMGNARKQTVVISFASPQRGEQGEGPHYSLGSAAITALTVWP